MVAPKRKREDLQSDAALPALVRPKAGTKSFASGKAVRDALATGNPQAFVSLRQQITTPYSQLPLAINHPAVVVLQHYLDLSPTCDEIFRAWQVGDQTKSEQQTHAAVELLAEIISVLSPIPFFRSTIVGLVNKIVAGAEPYHDLLNRLIQSAKRDDLYHGLLLAQAALSVDPPSPTPIPAGSTGGDSTTGRLGLKVWMVLVEGGSVRGLGKQMGMRRRNKEGMVAYGDRDPYDKPDIRHLILRLILPLLPSPLFHPHAKSLLPALFSSLPADPPLTILRILTALWSAISSPSPGLNRRTALVLFHEKSIEALWGMLGREDREEGSGKTVGEMVGAFLEGVTATPGKGVCFPDEGWYPRQVESSDSSNPTAPADPSTSAAPAPESNGDHHDPTNRRLGLHNRILSNIIRKPGSKVVDDDDSVGSWLLSVLRACPELVAGYWPHSALGVDPRLAARWLATMAFIGRVVSLPLPDERTFRQPTSGPAGSGDREGAPWRSHPPALSTIIESIVPSPLTKAHLVKGLSHPDGVVQHMTGVTLARCLSKLESVQALFKRIEREIEEGAEATGVPLGGDNPWARRRRELEMEVRKRIPDLSVIIAFAQRSATLSLAEPETPAELALATKSTMLTELALRLLMLCNRTLPTLIASLKFDPGRLLVSASSAGAERRARREAREGSVVSDSGSVYSVGTVGSAGTAGMGGGFGTARGEVEGFEALSQVHVLELLGEVSDWSWGNKAAGSQYTYLYHILLLHLSTPLPTTHSKTTSLLSHLLLPTLLFSHDPTELPIWLSALPHTSASARGPMLLAQQIQLLAFLDDCFRRCLKTPYRYFEDAFALAPGWAGYTDQKGMVSPLVMTLVEQLGAKLAGQLISTETAGFVVDYLGRVILGLVGKQTGLGFLEGVVGRVEEGVKKAKAEGQARVGLEESVQRIKDTLEVVQGKRPSLEADLPEDSTPRLLDTAHWNANSFEYKLLTTPLDVIFLPGLFAFIPSATSPAADEAATILRFTRFILHLNLSPDSTGVLRFEDARSAALHLLDKCLAGVKGLGKAESGVKRIVFEDPGVRGLALKAEGDVYRPELNALIKHLQTGSTTDQGIAETYADELVEALKADKKGKQAKEILERLQPWVPFLLQPQATTTTTLLFKLVPKLSPALTPSLRRTISAILTATRSPKFVLGSLEEVIQLGALGAVSALVQGALGAPTREGRSEVLTMPVKKDIIKQLLTTASDEAYTLLSTLVQSNSSAAKSAQSVLRKDPASLGDARILPVLEVLLELGKGEVEGVDVKEVGRLALASLGAKGTASKDVQAAAIRLLVLLARSSPQIIGTELVQLPLSEFTPALAQLVDELVAVRGEGKEDVVAGCRHVAGLGLQFAVRVCSSDVVLKSGELAALDSLTSAIGQTDKYEFELRQDLAEPVVMAVIEDRLAVREAAELATLLATRVELKASFLRQQLQALLSTSTYTQCTITSPPPPPSLRQTFTRLLHALFSASTYVSCSSPAFIEPLLALYRGTLSEADRRVLHMFQLFEGYRKVSVASVMRYWSANGVMGGGGKSFDALTSLDAGKVFATCQAYPLRRTLRGWGHPSEDPEEGSEVYDPVFVMGLFIASMHEGMRGLDWVELLRSNVLGLTVCGLASRDVEVRSVAGYALGKAMVMVQKTGFYERPQLVYTLRLLRHALPTHTTRLPTLTTLFFAHALRALANPSHFFYPASSRFLLQRPVFDAGDTPMLYGMLYASGEGWKRERGWMVRFLKEGVRSEADWRVVRRRKVWSLLATMFTSSLDPTFRRSVLQTMSAILAIPGAARSLTLRDGLLVWLTMQWTLINARHSSPSSRGGKAARSATWEKDEKALILQMAERVCEVMGMTEGERVLEDGGKEVRSWVRQAEVFVKGVVAGEVDAERLETLVKITFSLSQIPGNTTTPILFPLLVSKLLTLPPSSPEHLTETITAYLFQTGLALRPAVIASSAELDEAVGEVGWRVERGDAGKELGEWVRRERRAGQAARVGGA
ncbi:hypothetical protein IAT38_006288 [Cryptococcus sp. DSM 104549]